MRKEVWRWVGQVQDDERVAQWQNVTVCLLVDQNGEYSYMVFMSGCSVVDFDPSRGAVPYRCECKRPLICFHIRAVMSANWARAPIRP